MMLKMEQSWRLAYYFSTIHTGCYLLFPLYWMFSLSDVVRPYVQNLIQILSCIVKTALMIRDSVLICFTISSIVYVLLYFIHAL